jgi:2-dehydro-3-deoxyphosphogluconate aldolase/(4S)-4-hydroxy-2-oxoglutarate aldolase
LNKQAARTQIEEIGIVPCIRVTKTEDAIFAAEAVACGGIPILEIAAPDHQAVKVLAEVVRRVPHVLAGAGSVPDAEIVRACVDAGAQFVSSDGLDADMLAFALQQDVVVIPGTLTPSDVLAAWKLSPDFVKVVPCGHLGGDSYIRSLKEMFPMVPMIAAGGVDQRTAFDLIRAGAVALEIAGELVPRDAIRHRQSDQIIELARRYLQFVGNARSQFATR